MHVVGLPERYASWIGTPFPSLIGISVNSVYNENEEEQKGNRCLKDIYSFCPENTLIVLLKSKEVKLKIKLHDHVFAFSNEIDREVNGLETKIMPMEGMKTLKDKLNKEINSRINDVN